MRLLVFFISLAVALADGAIRWYCIITTSELISLVTLELVLGTFWWINLSPAMIALSKPRSFSICGGGAKGKVVAHVPMIFYNKGATTGLIRNIRVKIPELANKELAFGARVPDLDKGGNEQTRKWATQFAVERVQPVSFIGQFTGHPGVTLEAGKLTFIIEAQFEGKDSWKELNRFIFKVEERRLAKINTNLIPYDLCDVTDN